MIMEAHVIETSRHVSETPRAWVYHCGERSEERVDLTKPVSRCMQTSKASRHYRIIL